MQTVPQRALDYGPGLGGIQIQNQIHIEIHLYLRPPKRWFGVVQKKTVLLYHLIIFTAFEYEHTNSDITDSLAYECKQ